ncbi:hypothetical protein [Streptomyces pseudovenezuelae]|uniref:hypothetical protein n=1 Tax=Streptomyces pseudovenezuelae TaxID=67350 RepID=UPI002E80F45A|nr:hypothetical protein [Streptomyces pseudovenezuelae]WUA89991.1 hypothetical protein OHO81_23025 [Streptomyces pseudovenezuelae]
MLIATNAWGHVEKRPSKRKIGTMLADLDQDDHLILERQDESQEGSWYIQVLFRETNTYQLEHRDGVPAEHYQTQTVSQEKVLQALLDWAAHKPAWREGFMWTNIGHWFTPTRENEDDPTV